MKKNKILNIVLAIILTMTTMSTFGCKTKEETNSDPLTLNVRIHEAGYGTSYIYAIKDKFEQAFVDEDYKLNVLAPKTDIGGSLVYQDIYADGGVDVYIAGCDAEESATGEYSENGSQPVFLKLDDEVIGKSAINFSGEEESGTIGEKLSGFNFDRATVYNDDYYGLPVALSIGGYAVNLKVLESYELDVPVTTKDLQNCIDKIMKKAANDVNDGMMVYDVVKPFAYSLKGNNYAMNVANPWFAQYSGKEAYDKFWTFTDADGEMFDDCYEVFNDKGIEEMFKIMFEVYDKSLAAQGFATQDFRSAQSQLLLGKAAFCPTGDWMFNEEVATYSEQIKDVAFIKVPIISSLGEKLFGAGTKYNFDENKCEQILKEIAMAADENKTVEEIKATMDSKYNFEFDVKDIESVCERRGYMRDASSESAYISSKTTKQEVAFAFLRFLASNDCATLFAEEANTTSPFAVGTMDESYVWRKNVNDITSNRYFKQLISEARGYRLALGVTDMFYRKTYIASNIQEENLIIYNVKTLKIEGSRAIYADKSKSYTKAIYEDAKVNASSVWKIN